MTVRPTKTARLLRRKMARQYRALDRAITPQEAHAALLQLRAIRSRINRIAA